MKGIGISICYTRANLSLLCCTQASGKSFSKRIFTVHFLTPLLLSLPYSAFASAFCGYRSADSDWGLVVDPTQDKMEVLPDGFVGRAVFCELWVERTAA